MINTTDKGSGASAPGRLEKVFLSCIFQQQSGSAASYPTQPSLAVGRCFSESALVEREMRINFGHSTSVLPKARHHKLAEPKQCTTTMATSLGYVVEECNRKDGHNLPSWSMAPTPRYAARTVTIRNAQI
ncbi:hypothetical protein TRVL_05184 [Trypanosoma vivax]|nr:hypothetical protein TRVL_05184 [Trypanosoma vivax]